jgi:hypothetical protein
MRSKFTLLALSISILSIFSCSNRSQNLGNSFKLAYVEEIQKGKAIFYIEEPILHFDELDSIGYNDNYIIVVESQNITSKKYFVLEKKKIEKTYGRPHLIGIIGPLSRSQYNMTLDSIGLKKIDLESDKLSW